MSSLRSGRRGVGLAATTLVTAGAFLALGGSGLLLHPGRVPFGRNPSNDFQIMTWSLRFWPWAIAHGYVPLRTSLLWAPTGFSTVWLTSIPGPALVALPVTLTAGPIAAYNLLVVVAATLASAAAYLLCFELTESMFASTLGSLVFGLSPYVLGHAMSEHLNLLVVFPLPLLGLGCVRYLRGKTSKSRFVATSTGLLVILASSSLELLLDTIVVLVVVGVAGLLMRGEPPSAVRRLAVPAAYAFAMFMPVVAAVGIVGLTSAHAQVSHAPADFSTDLLNVVVPTPTVLAGAAGWIAHASSFFVGNIGERDGFLGLPILLVCAAALRAEWRRLWAAGIALVVALLVSLGPVVAVGGRPIVSLPVSLSDLPVVGNALPARFAIFAALAAAVLVSVWLARPGHARFRAVTALVIAAFLVPNFWPTRSLPRAWATSTEFSWSTASVPAGFVGDRRWRTLVRPDSNVLVLPTGDRTVAQWWQTESGMQFSLAAPETPFVPPALAADPTVAKIVDDVLPQLDGPALAAARLRGFLSQRAVDTVVVTPRGRRLWLPVVRRATGRRGRHINRDYVFAVPLPERTAVVRRRVRQVPRSAHLGVWLEFDGRRGRVLVDERKTAAVVLSRGDAESAAATARGSGAAVAFVEWNGSLDLLRVATRDGSRWPVSTLDRNGAPIWSQKVTLTRNGTVVAGWIDDVGRERRLLVASRRPGGRWTKPTTLDTGEGLASFTFFRPPRGGLIVGWSDRLAAEWRVLASRFESGRWTAAATMATSLGGLDAAAVLRAKNPVFLRTTTLLASGARPDVAGD